MLTRERILVIAATARELAESNGWRTLECGVGPVEAGLAVATEIARDRPSAILHVGIAGARRKASIPAGTIVVGTTSIYCDLTPRNPFSPRLLTANGAMVDALRDAIDGAIAKPIGTSARVGGTSECQVEAMEGFAVLRAAERAGIPAIEVRVISNEIEETDRTKWQFDLGFRTIRDATPALVEALCRCVS